MVQMGVKRIFLDAAFEGAKSAWMAPSLGFTEISKEEYEILALQFTFVSNPKVAARCIKVVPAHAALLKQVSCACICFVCCDSMAPAYHCDSPLLQTECTLTRLPQPHLHHLCHTEPVRNRVKAVPGIVTKRV